MHANSLLFLLSGALTITLTSALPQPAAIDSELSAAVAVEPIPTAVAYVDSMKRGQPARTPVNILVSQTQPAPYSQVTIPYMDEVAATKNDMGGCGVKKRDEFDGSDEEWHEVQKRSRNKFGCGM